MILGLLIVLVLVLVLPFAIPKVEHNIEAFLLAMGTIAAILGGVMELRLIGDALVYPWKITAAVLLMGFVFKWTRKPIEGAVRSLLVRIPVHLFVFGLIVILGLGSSVITVIIASLLLVEVISILQLERKAEIRIVILSCFSLGMGAALTPIGEPLSTIAVVKLSGAPYHAGFWFLLQKLGTWIIPGIFGFALLSLFFHEKKAKTQDDTLVELEEEVRRDESYIEIFIRACKVYIFVVALIFLGEGFKPLIERYVLHWPALALYWVNIISAVLDNATLTAAEISPSMGENQIRDILLGLLISGGMLIPGNIPNIIAAQKLRISMKEWAVFAVPVGLAAMVVYFLLLLAFQ
jgi:predicted cation transporter